MITPGQRTQGERQKVTFIEMKVSQGDEDKRVSLSASESTRVFPGDI